MKKNNFNINDDAGVAIGIGLVKGVDAWSSFGAVGSTISDVEKDVGAGVVTEFNLPDNAGELLEIVSADAGDTDTISVSGLGAQGVRRDAAEVVLNGTTPVPLPGVFSRVNGAQSIGVNGFEGDLIIRPLGGGVTFMTVPASGQRSAQTLYTVAAGQTASITTMVGTMEKSSGSDASAVVSLKVKGFAQNKWGKVFGFGLQRSGDTSIQFDNRYPQVLEGPLDIKVSVTSSSDIGAAAWVSGLRIDTGAQT